MNVDFAEGDDIVRIVVGSVPASVVVCCSALNTCPSELTCNPVGACVNADMGDPATGEVEGVFGPTDSVGTKLFGSLSVLVAVREVAKTSEVYGDSFVFKVDHRDGCIWACPKESLFEEKVWSTVKEFVHGCATRCREMTIEGETSDVSYEETFVIITDGAKCCRGVGTGCR